VNAFREAGVDLWPSLKSAIWH